jgi:uncharacterized protein (TIGR02596 family)
MIQRRAFTLVELLAVMAVAGVLMALVLPAFQSIGDAAKIRQAAAGVIDQVDAARQWAEVNGATVELRLLRAPGQTHYTGIQMWSGDGNLILDKPVGLPDGVAILANSDLSPLLERMSSPEPMPGAASATAGSRWEGGEFAAFRIRPSGAIELASAPSGAARSRLFFTLAPERSAGVANPVNYATIQLNPDTARPLLYRP